VGPVCSELLSANNPLITTKNQGKLDFLTRLLATPPPVSAAFSSCFAEAAALDGDMEQGTIREAVFQILGPIMPMSSRQGNPLRLTWNDAHPLSGPVAFRLLNSRFLR
jgi:hypothetical protein